MSGDFALIKIMHIHVYVLYRYTACATSPLWTQRAKSYTTPETFPTHLDMRPSGSYRYSVVSCCPNGSFLCSTVEAEWRKKHISFQSQYTAQVKKDVKIARWLS